MSVPDGGFGDDTDDFGVLDDGKRLDSRLDEPGKCDLRAVVRRHRVDFAAVGHHRTVRLERVYDIGVFVGYLRLHHVLDAEDAKPFQGPVGTDEVLDELRFRRIEQRRRRVVLDEFAVVHDGDAVTHLQRLVDVVRDEDDGRIDLLLYLDELVL